MPSPPPNPRPLWILLAWCAINLLQAALSPLDPDETYYWMYAARLDWGYFDHPPAVALLVSLGKDWLPGALGLRFGHVLTGTALLVVLYYLLDRPAGKWLWLAAALVLAQPMLQVYGFIATPDGPLLLFTTLYLLVYRRFLRQPSVATGVVWGLTMAGLLYSKYHGVMLIFFSVLPNLGFLIRRPGAWVAALGGAALFSPHLYWQYVHDYPSFRYHLSGRDDPYQFKYTTQYLLNQLLIFSPLLLYYYYRTFTVDRARDSFERACRWLVIGLLLFFLYTTTKGRTEAQWTALLSIPLVYLTYRAAQRHTTWYRGLLRMCYLTIGLLLVGRLLLLSPREWLPFAKPFDHQPWVERLAEIAGDRPVMVENSYRLASLYEFYSGGKPGYTFTNVEYRPSQYDLWRGDTAFHDRSVMVLGQPNWNTPDYRFFRTQAKDRPMHLRQIDRFQVAKQVRLTATTPLPDRLRPTDRFPLRLVALTDLPVALDTELPLDLYVILQYPGGHQEYWRLRSLSTQQLPANEPAELFNGEVRIPSTTTPGEVYLEFGLAYRGMPPLRGQSTSTELSLLPPK